MNAEQDKSNLQDGQESRSSGRNKTVMPVCLALLLAAVVIACIKAFQGEMFKLPVIGDMAERQAGAI